ncbi:hypothetical protein AAFC00_005141 [Neodothiora populina]|uniref:ACB domain-containing protein n=1 Tax=Neodothiora populina TaxID=2781224 RepID=A0ABR3PK69_9PEZI
MADSVDRVFGHALNTVNKIRTGSQKPPVSERLKLYGLYKQAMEGDVEYIQPRPSSAQPAGASSTTIISASDIRREQDKWDAWHAHAGLSRTAAKKAYIETLISTMHTYASATPEARELVAELEFVWDQVRDNSNPASGGSDRSSPVQQHGSYPGLGVSTSAAGGENLGGGTPPSQRSQQQQQQDQPLRILSPVSQGTQEDDQEREDEEFVDAPAYSQYEGEDQEGDSEHHVMGGARDGYGAVVEDIPPERPRPRRRPSGDSHWRKRIESALVKVSTEVAALREQLESRSYVAQKRRHSILGWILRLSWFFVRLLVVDVFVLWLVILWLRRRKDRRLEGAVRVLLGDAVAQMQKVGSNMKVPKLPSRKS